PTAVTPRWERTRVPRRRSPLALATLAAALLAVGVALLLDSAGVISLSVGMGFAIALLVVGVGLLIGTWFGRSRGLAVLGVLLLPCAAVASLVDVPLSGGTGTVSFAPQALSDVQPQYHLAAGDLTVDLTQLAVNADRTVTVTVGLGRLRVLVPDPADVVVTAHAGAGHINLFGAFDDGVNIGSSAQSTPTVGGSVLHLTVNVGLGEVDVVRSSPGTGSGG
ncbi:MAG: cell wall-active antibiotics response protein, partial [Candidatus Dormibacteraeota bacterium]|nr:cell wall-active antibiotics response protein [Candidatus Dormibacteraeota bacterium]